MHPRYTFTHNRQNIISSIISPQIIPVVGIIFDIVHIFPEYTLSDTYFDLDHMKAMDLNPVLDEKWLENRSTIKADLDSENLTIEKGRILTYVIAKNRKIAVQNQLIPVIFANIFILRIQSYLRHHLMNGKGEYTILTIRFL